MELAASLKAFDHLMVNLWGYPLDSPISLALKHQGYHVNMKALLCATDDELKCLEFFELNGVSSKLSASVLCRKMKLLHSFLQHWKQSGHSIHIRHFTKISYGDYHHWFHHVHIHQGSNVQSTSRPVVKRPTKVSKSVVKKPTKVSVVAEPTSMQVLLLMTCFRVMGR